MTGLQIAAGVSTFFGLAGLIAYLYYDLEVRRAERSIADLIQGETLFNAKQVVQILAQFKDDASRLKALKALTHYGGTQAAALLEKVKSNIDVQALARSTGNNKRAGLIAIFFLLLALIAAVFYKLPTMEKCNVPLEQRPLDCPTS